MFSSLRPLSTTFIKRQRESPLPETDIAEHLQLGDTAVLVMLDVFIALVALLLIIGTHQLYVSFRRAQLKRRLRSAPCTTPTPVAAGIPRICQHRPVSVRKEHESDVCQVAQVAAPPATMLSSEESRIARILDYLSDLPVGRPPSRQLPRQSVISVASRITTSQSFSIRSSVRSSVSSIAPPRRRSFDLAILMRQFPPPPPPTEEEPISPLEHLSRSAMTSVISLQSHEQYNMTMDSGYSGSSRSSTHVGTPMCGDWDGTDAFGPKFKALPIAEAQLRMVTCADDFDQSPNQSRFSAWTTTSQTPSRKTKGILNQGLERLQDSGFLSVLSPKGSLASLRSVVVRQQATTISPVTPVVVSSPTPAKTVKLSMSKSTSTKFFLDMFRKENDYNDHPMPNTLNMV